jgi:hypothetical protein
LIANIVAIVVFGAGVRLAEGLDPLIGLSILVAVTGIVASAGILVAALLRDHPDAPRTRRAPACRPCAAQPAVRRSMTDGGFGPSGEVRLPNS